MPAIILTALTWLGRVGLAAFAVNEIRSFLNGNKEYLDNSVNAAEQAGVTQDDQKQLIAATTYEQVEKGGGSPDDFWAGLSPAEKEALQFSPESLRRSMGRTKFLGISSAFLFVGALVAGGVGALRGIPIALRTLARIAEARKAGASALQLMAIFEEGKIAGLAKVWVPGFIAGIASAGGWLTASMTNNLNDADLWGRIFLGQAADDFEKAARQSGGSFTSGGSGGGTESSNRTVIRMVEEKKPEQFIGTLFSAKLGRADSFERKLDDEITDLDDLREDAKINLNRWLASLPNRLGYSVVIRKDPVDEFGTKQSGIWATLTLFITHISGKTSPIDTILLGPVTPATRLELTKQTKQIESEITGFVKAASVREIEVPNGIVDVFTPEGERASLAGIQAENASAGAAFAGTGVDSSSKNAAIDEFEREIQEIAQGKRSVQSKVREVEEKREKAKADGTFQEPATPSIETYPGREAGPIESKTGLRPWTAVLTDTPGSVLNLRSGAGTNRSIVDKIPHNTKVFYTGRSDQNIMGLWVFVKWPKADGTEVEGYVHSDFIKAI